MKAQQRERRFEFERLATHTTSAGYVPRAGMLRGACNPLDEQSGSGCAAAANLLTISDLEALCAHYRTIGLAILDTLGQGDADQMPWGTQPVSSPFQPAGHHDRLSARA